MPTVLNSHQRKENTTHATLSSRITNRVTVVTIVHHLYYQILKDKAI